MSVFSRFSHTGRGSPLLGVLLGTLIVSCGGGSTPASKTADASEPGGEGELNDSEDTASADAEGAPQASGPDCSDGTCFVCGAGLCPTGFYCDEQAKNGPACGWLPECAEAANCGCVTGVLGSGCSCDDSNGGPSIRCD